MATDLLLKEGITTAITVLFYEPSLKIPLLMKLPGIEPKKINALVRTIDVMPTLLSYLDIKDKAERDGLDLMPLIRGKVSAGPEFIYIETEFQRFFPHKKKKDTRQRALKKLKMVCSQTGIRKDPWKYFAIHKSVDGPVKEFLFNLREDPGETKNLMLDYPQQAEELKKLLKPYREDTVFVNPMRGMRNIDKKQKEQDQQMMQQLKSLGYIQ